MEAFVSVILAVSRPTKAGKIIAEAPVVFLTMKGNPRESNAAS